MARFRRGYQKKTAVLKHVWRKEHGERAFLYQVIPKYQLPVPVEDSIGHIWERVEFILSLVVKDIDGRGFRTTGYAACQNGQIIFYHPIREQRIGDDPIRVVRDLGYVLYKVNRADSTHDPKPPLRKRRK